MKNNEPGNPKKTTIFNKLNKNNLGHKKFIADISKINLVLNLLAIESIIKKELVDSIAWLIYIPKADKSKILLPLNEQISNQCISTTVE